MHNEGPKKRENEQKQVTALLFREITALHRQRIAVQLIQRVIQYFKLTNTIMSL